MYHNQTEILHDGWLIQHDPDDIGKAENWKCGIPTHGAKECVVPSFGHQSFPSEYGIFWYQKTLTPKLAPTADQVVLLRVGSADFTTEAYVNGTLVGTHAGNENPFAFDVTDALRYGEENLLVLRIGKPYEKDVDGYRFWEIPHRNQRQDIIWPGHCHNEAGISGQVELALLPKLRIHDMYLVGNVKTDAIDVEYTLHSDYTDSRVCTLTTRVSNKRTGELCEQTVCVKRLESGDTRVSLSVPIDAVQRWSLDDPFLYVVSAELTCGEVCHTLSRHTGFREFKVGEDGYFYLNDKRLFLRCSHTGNAFPYSTHAIPPSPDFVRRDLYMAKAAGLNTVRFIAGTCLPDQLDYADEIGLIIYEEPTASWLTHNGPRSKELFSYDLVQMLLRDRSHPSVCIWGMLNETVPTPPFDECCRWGRELLPLLREYDRTRLVIYSSGRFDGDAFTGSVSNPGSDKWECLWNKEDENSTLHSVWTPPNPGAFFENIGDVHIYPRLPVSKYDRNLIRTVGCDVKRPVFLSEFGTGSMFDTVWLTKMFDQLDIDKELPDVKQIYHMNECFLRDLKAFGFEEECAFPQVIMRESQKLHARQRAYNFDMVRANPYLCGYSITGLLDHSICGEGLWTLMREWKPGCVDAMQNGFAKLKWCMFLDDMHVYAGRPVRFEAVIANEDMLKERDYPVCFRILGENGVIWEKKTVLHPTAEQLATFAIPVLDEMITLDAPTGCYQMHADIEGAAVMDSQLNFYLTNETDFKATITSVVTTDLNDNTRALLNRLGIQVCPLEQADVSVPSVVLVDWVSEERRRDIFQKLAAMIRSGSHVFFANRHTLNHPEYNTLLPIEHLPSIAGEADWLYHLEYLAKRKHPYFQNMPKGMMDWEYYMYLINGMHFKGGQLPDEIAAASFGTGCINPDGYYGGYNLATYHLPAGAITICSYNLMENIGNNPAADHLLLNILNTENDRCKNHKKQP